MVEIGLSLLESHSLSSGSHARRGQGTCAMELVAWMAGEPHSDHPSCASPVIAALVRNWNDALRTNEERDRLLKPLLPTLIGTATTPDHEIRRAWMATDWLVRVQAPAWVELAGLDADAGDLRALPEMVDAQSARAGMAALQKARSNADAAGDAAGDAARDAAGAKLAPVVATLQSSAQDLIRRMCAVGRES